MECIRICLSTGLRYPGRVVGGGGIFLEYDDRDVPDVASIIADYHEGVQGLVRSMMCSEEIKLQHLIRGHHGLLHIHKDCFGNSGKGTYEFVPERSQVTLDSKLNRATFDVQTKYDINTMHFANFLDAVQVGKPHAVNNDPELGAAAVMFVKLAVRSYREGQVFQIDLAGRISSGDDRWADRWERMSREKSTPRHVPGWTAGDAGSVLYPLEYQKLAGAWVDGRPPEDNLG